MCGARRLYRYLQYWWTTPIYWNRLFTDTRDSFFLCSMFTFSFYGLIFFFDSSYYYFRIFLHVFLGLNVIVFTVLLWDWIRRKGRILFPKMTLLHGREHQEFGVAWEVPENPQEHQYPQLPRNVGAVMRLGNQVYRMPGHELVTPQPPFVPEHLEYRQIQAQIYRRSRITDRPGSQHKSGFSYKSTLEPTREPTYSSRTLQFALSEQQTPRQSTRIPDYERYSLGESSKDDTQQSNVTSGQNIRIEVHAPMKDTSQQIRSPYDLINYGAGPSRDSRDDYDYELHEISPRFQTTRLSIRSVERGESDDSSLGIPKSPSSDKTEKDGDNASRGSPSGSSVGQESDSLSDRSVSKEKHMVVPLSVAELDTASEMSEIPGSSALMEEKSKKLSKSALKRSSLEMYERFQIAKTTKDASVSETSFSEKSEQEDLFSTTQASKLEACSSPLETFPHSSKKSSVLLRVSEQPLLHTSRETTQKSKEITSSSEKDVEISRTPKSTSSTPEQTKEISGTPEQTKEISGTPEQTKKISSTPEKTKEISSTPKKTKRTFTTGKTKRTAKRKKETSSEDEDVSTSQPKVHKQRSKPPLKIPKIEEAFESDDSD